MKLVFRPEATFDAGGGVEHVQGFVAAHDHGRGGEDAGGDAVLRDDADADGVIRHRPAGAAVNDVAVSAALEHEEAPVVAGGGDADSAAQTDATVALADFFRISLFGKMAPSLPWTQKARCSLCQMPVASC